MKKKAPLSGKWFVSKTGHMAQVVRRGGDVYRPYKFLHVRTDIGRMLLGDGSWSERAVLNLGSIVQRSTIRARCLAEGRSLPKMEKARRDTIRSKRAAKAKAGGAS